MQIFRWGGRESWTAATNLVELPNFNTGAPSSNMLTPQPGEMASIEDGFIIRDSPSGRANDYFSIKNTDTSETVNYSIPTGDYSGSSLATFLQVRTALEFASAGYTDPVLTCSYSATTKLFTFGSTANTSIIWSQTAKTQRLAAMMGFPDTDTTPGTSHVGTSAVFGDVHWLVWFRGALPVGGSYDPIKSVMLYDTNLDSGDRWRIFIAGANLGPDVYDWIDGVGAMQYDSGWQTSSASGINEIYCAVDPDPVITYAGDIIGPYIGIFFERNGTVTAASTTDVGVVALWDVAAYEGARDWAAWEPNPQAPDRFAYATRGGGSWCDKVRAYYEPRTICRGWSHSEALALMELGTKYGGEPFLVVHDPDDVQEDSAYFCRLEGVTVPAVFGVNNRHDVTLEWRQIAMHPRGDDS